MAAGLLTIILAGAAVAPAVPVEARTWFTPQENPKTALQVGESGPLAYAIDVAPDGTAIRCTAREASDLGRKVCEIVMKRARFQPASDDQGRPAFAVHDGLANILMPGKHTRPDPARLTVAVDRLPDGVTGPAYARVAFLVGAAGAVSHCALAAGERRRSLQIVDALGPAACDHAVNGYRPAPARNAAGEAVASVQSLLVKFEVR